MNEVFESFDLLVEALYGAMLGECGWVSFLALLGKVLPDGRAALFFHERNKPSGAFALTEGFDPSYLSAYNKHYARVNPWMPMANHRKVGLGVRAEQMLPTEQLRKTEFYADFLQPQGIKTAVGVTIRREASVNFNLSILCGEVDKERAQAGADLLTRLAPHVHKAFDYYQRLTLSEAQSGALKALLNSSRIAAVLIDQQCRARSCNREAEILLEKGDLMRLDRAGKVRIDDEVVEHALKKMLSREPWGDQFREMQTWLVPMKCGPMPMRLTLMSYGLGGAEHYFVGPKVLLIAENLEKPLPPCSLVSSAFRLTPAESRIAVGLVEGRSVGELAAELDITTGTVRNHLHNMFLKLGVRRQSDIVQLVLRATSGSFGQLPGSD